MFRREINYSVNQDKYGGYSKEIEELIPSGSRVLDIGCATGKLAQALKKRKCVVCGVDIDDASLRMAKKYCDKVLKIDVDDLNLLDQKLKNKKFDIIALGDILEHLKYPGVLLNHMRKFLDKNGAIIASIPNSAFIWMRLRYLFGIFDYSKGGGLMDEDHLRFFSLKTARLLFEDANYKIIKAKPSSLGIVKLRYKFITLLTKILPTLFAIHVIIIAEPNKGKR